MEQLTADVSIIPRMGEQEARELSRTLFGMTVKTIQEFASYEDRSFFISEGNVEDIEHATGYVLKVINSRDSSQTAFYEVQNKLLLHLTEKGFNVPVPIQNVHGEMAFIQRIAEQSHLAALFKYIPGRPLSDVPITTQLISRVGRFLGKLHNALQEFPTTSALHRTHLWSLEALSELRRYLQFLSDEERRTLILSVVETFERECLARLEKMPKGIIHGDINCSNIIVRRCDAGNEVDGIIDFAHTHVTALVFDVALGIAYLSLDCECIDYILAGGHFLAGYLEERKLSELEWQVLRVAITARLAQSLTIGCYTSCQDPSNAYVQTTQKKGWTRLRRFVETSSNELSAKWKDVIASYDSKE